MIVYINTQGAHIVKEGCHLLVKKSDDIYNALESCAFPEVECDQLRKPDQVI